MKVGAWYKVAASGAESNPTLDFSSTTTLLGEACVSVFPQTAGGMDDAGLLDSSVAVADDRRDECDIGHDPGADWVARLACVIGVSDDSAAFSRLAADISMVTGTVIWNGNYTEAPATHASTTTGNDMAADAGYRLITTGNVTPGTLGPMRPSRLTSPVQSCGSSSVTPACWWW